MAAILLMLIMTYKTRHFPINPTNFSLTIRPSWGSLMAPKLPNPFLYQMAYQLSFLVIFYDAYRDVWRESPNRDFTCLTND